jgi:hypothetical protein
MKQKTINFKKNVEEKTLETTRLIWQINHPRYEIIIKKIILSKEGPNKKDWSSIKKTHKEKWKNHKAQKPII